MGRGDSAAGELPSAEVRAAATQPPCSDASSPGGSGDPIDDPHADHVNEYQVKDGVELGRSVALDDVLATMGAEFAEEVWRREENLRRREADRELLAELATCGFAGRFYRRFEEELARYAMAVLRGWMHSGYIFTLTAARGFPLHPSGAELEELFRDSDARDELAIMTVAETLPRFRERALVGDGWRFDGGATVATYFMGACLYVFPNELRKRRVQHRRWQRQDRSDPGLPIFDESRFSDPAVITVGNQGVRDDLAEVDERTRTVVALTIDGYSQDEIAEMLDEPSARTVEGVLYRWRVKEKARRRKGGADG